MIKIVIIGTVIIIAFLTVILNTELLGDDATFGACIISASGQSGGYASSEASTSEKQCKKYCISDGIAEKNEDRDVFCKFYTISGLWLV